MLRGLLLLISVIAVFAADTVDPWKKVRELKSGTDVRIIRAGASSSIMAKFAELTDENLIVVVKNEQIAIPREKVFRIDSRPQKGVVTTETQINTASDSASTRSVPNPPNATPTNATSYSTGVAITEKTEFETIYRRAPAPAPAKKK